MLPSRLYAILDVDVTAAHGLGVDAVFDAWLAAGVRLIQLRAKLMPSGAYLALATRLAARAREAGAAFLVNDRADISRLSGAAGVHVGQTDLTPRDARRLVGAEALVGRSTHSAEELGAALAEPIDYLAVGAVYPTTTKPAGHPTVGLDGVRRAKEAARDRGLPIVGIGGIQLDTAPAVIAAGASAVAVISDLLVGDPRTRAQDYLRALGELTL